MEHHLGYKKHSSDGDNTGNSRNGYSKKKVLTRDQSVELSVPRDRNAEFEPEIVPKYAKRLQLFNNQIISLYSRDMTTRDIQAHLNEIYGVDVSAELISTVTNAVHDDVRAWRTRPLDSTYPIVYLDALRVNSRQNGKNENKALYLGIRHKHGGEERSIRLLSERDRRSKVLDERSDRPEASRSRRYIHSMYGRFNRISRCSASYISKNESPAVYSSHGK